MSISKVGPWVLSVAALCVAVAAYVEARREPSELTLETLRIRDRAGHRRMVISVEREADSPGIAMLTPNGTVTAGLSANPSGSSSLIFTRPDGSMSASLTGSAGNGATSSLSLFGAGKSELALVGGDQAIVLSRKADGSRSLIDLERNQRVHYGPDGKPSLGPGPIEPTP